VTTRTYRTFLVLGMLALLGTAAACSDDDDESGSTTAAPAATAVAPEATGAGTAAPETAGAAGTVAPSAAGEATVMVAESSEGPILVDADGMTLYVFMPDEAGPSTCTGQCIASWPAFTGPATAGEGADAALLGTSTRSDDSTEQATYNGWPLYYFGGDEAPGDVNGQGLSDVWYVVDAGGNPVDSD
jgi:predicted lipoprotein with Yx(FWY)xxD motif